MSRPDLVVRTGTVNVDALVGKWLPDQKQLELALKTAKRKTMTWARAAAIRAIRAETGLPAALLKNRISIYFESHNGRSRLFFGLRPVPVSWLNPRQGKAGVKTKGGGHVSGAFIVDFPSGPAVFKRVCDDRYPLEFQRIYFTAPAERAIRADILPHWEAEFFKRLEQELKWRTR